MCPDHVTAGYGKPHMTLPEAALRIELLKDEVLSLKREILRLRAENWELQKKAVA